MRLEEGRERERKRFRRLKREIEEEKRKIRERKKRAGLLAVMCAAVLFVVLFVEVLGMRMVYGESMYPGYREGDVVVYRKGRGELKIGDVVVVETKEGDLLKRVAGLPGDQIEIEEGSGRVRRNEVTQEEKYAIGKEKGKSNIRYPYEVGEGEVFLLGDNREYSMDSRSKEFGKVREEQVKGKVILLIRRERKAE